ncbi:alpha/beta hydrolase family protein [bacterium]|nr:alpha/beta hydrolase family protein [bacterium]
MSIKLARWSVRAGGDGPARVAEAEALVQDRRFFADFAAAPAEFRLTARGRFRFASPVASPWGRNNTVHGRWFPAGQDWRTRPAVLLVHGWNAELGYRTLFPWLARRLNRAGLNAVMFELPYHSRRKPGRRQRPAPRNFLSGDVVHVVTAMHQALADARALTGWLAAQGVPAIGTWGISLGGWLAGLLACVDPRLGLAVLMTPVARMDRVLAEMEFCAPLRRNLGDAVLRMEPLNLGAHPLRVPPGKVLIVASTHDLFAPLSTLEDLHRTWRGSELWRSNHGHISAMMSAPVMERTVRWIARQTAGGQG